MRISTLALALLALLFLASGQAPAADSDFLKALYTAAYKAKGPSGAGPDYCFQLEGSNAGPYHAPTCAGSGGAPATVMGSQVLASQPTSNLAVVTAALNFREGGMASMLYGVTVINGMATPTEPMVFAGGVQVLSAQITGETIIVQIAAQNPSAPGKTPAPPAAQPAALKFTVKGNSLVFVK